jgi:DNA uptake protein ComE-like DNA-binding protein
MGKVRINLANPQELLEVPGIDRATAAAILRHRAEHGPICDALELGRIVGSTSVTDALLSHIDFEPAASTAPEAPGA